MKIIGVYKITNPNGAVYIGSSIDIKRRFNQYKRLNNSGRQPKLYNSFNKYGFDNHIFEILTECERVDLFKLERYYGDLYNSISKTNLNCTLPKTDDLPHLVSDETKIKLSEGRLGNKHWNYGKKLSIESKIKISNSHKGKKHTLEHRMKVSKNHSENKIVIDLNTGIYYNSGTELSKLLPISRSYLLSMLNGNRINKTPYKYA